MFTDMLAIVLVVVCVIQLEAARVTYKIDVKTGNVGYAGTDANVYIIIYGEHGDTGKIMLRSSATHKQKFEKSYLDKFSEEGADVGKITKIRVGHDNTGSGPGWYLDEVMIKIVDTTCEFTFNFHGWVSTGKLHKDLYPAADGRKCDEGTRVTYKIDVKTGNVRYAGTDANVYIIIYGEKGSTGKIMLRNSATNAQKFEQAYLDKFTEEAVDVGKITKIRIGHDNTGSGPGWYLDEVVIKIGDTSCEFIFPSYGWVSTGTLHKDLYPAADVKKCDQGARVTYKIDVKTGNVRYAGTDANVYIIIYGEKGDTGKIILRTSATHAQRFEKSYLDKFAEEALDVGRITKIRIGHDNRGSGPGWYLSEVMIKIEDTNCDFTFTANRWVHAGALQADLYPTIDRQKCNQGARVTYKIDVKTGNVGYAGTDANVYIIIYGDNGDTGKLMLRTSATYAQKFERYHLDKFTEEGFDVGKITKIRIGHDNAGSGPGWYLENVVINVQGITCEMTFSAKRWVHTGSLQAELFPTFDRKKCDHGKMTTYNIDVKTGNVAYAGTDANVFVVITGEKGTTGKFILKSSQTVGDKFERNDLDRFTVAGFDVGRISSIRIGHDNMNRHPGWYLESVVITVKETGCQATFTAKKWLKTGALESVLYPMFNKDKCNQGDMKTYNIDVKVNGKIDADAVIFVIIYGKTLDTGKLMLLKSQASKEGDVKNVHILSFSVQSINVGKITKIRMGHGDAKGKWYLEGVDIGIQGMTCKLSFHAGKWLVTKDEIIYPTLALDHCDNAMITYGITVKTGDGKSSGTDANVFIIIYGEKGDTGKLVLRNTQSGTDIFEKGQVNSFTGKAFDVGRISTIRIGHDNKGSNAGWYLDNVVIKVKSCSSTFTAWQWLEKGKLAFDLYPTLEKGTCKEEVSSGSICKRDFRKIGCFSRDWSKVPDLLITDLDPTHKNYTNDMNWNDYALGLHSLACRCRAKAEGHYKYFGIGFNGVCVAGKNNAALEIMFSADKGEGASNGCINGNWEACDKDEETECTGVEDYDFYYQIV